MKEVPQAALDDFERRNAEWFDRIRPKTDDLPDELPITIKAFLEQL